MNSTQVAIYARVSSEQQVSTNTIESQRLALQERVQRDGAVCPSHHQFVDDGYSGSTLIRPALEQLRDAIARGEIDRLYVHSPDRLARKYAYQVILVDEFTQAGVEVIFLNRPLGRRLKMNCSYRCKGWLLNTNAQKFLSAVVGEKDMQHRAVRSTLFPGHRMATPSSRNISQVDRCGWTSI